MDDDGDLDLILGDAFQPDTLYLNDGNGSFAAATNFRLDDTSARTHALALGDLDADGDLDLVSGTAHLNKLYLNLLRHASAALRARIGAPYSLDFHARAGFATAGQFITPYLSLSETRPTVGVPPFGRWGLGSVGLIGLPPLQVPSPSGKVSIQLPIPNSPSLNGRTLYTQVIVQHGVTLYSWRFSNVNADPIIR